MNILKFVLNNFGSLVVFYITNHFFGLQIAIIVSVIWTFVEIVLHLVRKQPITMFFKFTTVLTIIFGVVDLYLQRSFLFKFEAGLTNFMIGIFFLSTLYAKRPIIQEFAEARGRISQNISPDNVYYFKFLTVIWSIYSFIKGVFYMWIATTYDFEQGLAIRTVFGNVSFYILLAISIFGAKNLKSLLGKMKMLPSTRKS